jgi:hypothetical protein
MHPTHFIYEQFSSTLDILEPTYSSYKALWKRGKATSL